MSGPITYQLASAANYTFNIAKIGRHEYDELAYYFKDNFPDALISRRGAEMNLDKLESSYLWTVNGYVYNSVRDGDSLYIPNATKSMLRSRANKIGLLNFSGVTPAIKKLTITPSQVTMDVNIPAYEKVFITFPVPVKSPILVAAGYLIFENPNFFYRISDTTFAVMLNRLEYHEKLNELFKYRDIYKDLGVSVSPNNPTHVDANEVRSLETIRKFLTLESSFLIDLDIDAPIVKKPIYLEHSNIPSNFRTHKNPILPLFVGYGKLTEYFKTFINPNRYSVYTQDHVYNSYLLSKLDPRLIQNVTAHRALGPTHRLSNAFFLDIRTNS